MKLRSHITCSVMTRITAKLGLESAVLDFGEGRTCGWLHPNDALNNKTRRALKRRISYLRKHR